MKLVSRVILIACYAGAFAFGAGCSSGDPPSSAVEKPSSLSEELARGRGRPGGRPTNPCAAVLCGPGTSCEVVRGDAVCTPNEPPSDAVFCGGFAGIECPGVGQCFDDPSDDCDPENGGADCGGICDCSVVQVLCIRGTVFDNDPNVCACVPEEPEADPCAAVRCMAGTHCEVADGSATCAPDEDPCNLADCPPDRPVCEVQDGEAVCVAAGGGDAPFCGGIAAFPCPGVGQCIDDPSDDCDPENGGADCGGICDCSVVQVLCIQGTVFDNDPNVCACVPGEPPSEDPPFCGGIAAFECPGAGQCIDDPSDDCDPANGGADCGGICDCSGALVLCAPGTVFNEDPNVCACEPAEPEPDPCAAVRCRAGTHCEAHGPRAVCAPDHRGPCGRGR